MSPAEVAAYIGAAAWVPQIVGWVWSQYAIPCVTVIPDKRIELGYTRFGPIFNLRVALSTDKKDTILDSFHVQLTHENGETHRLRWAGMHENISTIRDAAGNTQDIVKEYPPIALRIGRESLIERFTRFQEDSFISDTRLTYNKLLAHYNFLKVSHDQYIREIVKSKEYFNFVDAHKKGFWWQKGRWDVRFEIGSPHKISVRSHRFTFGLSPSDINDLKRNLDEIDKDLENVVCSEDDSYQHKLVRWSWVNPELVNTSDA